VRENPVYLLMKKLVAIVLIFTSTISYCSAQACELHASAEERNSIVKLDWNMVNSTGKTTYILFRSTDGKNWTPVVTDKILRKYSGEDIFDYEDKFTYRGKIYYLLNILDASNNAIAVSKIITVNNEQGKGKGSWVIYPNPVHDVLTLAFKGDGYIKGVVNVQIQNASGKIVTKFRSASINRTIQIPVDNLTNGFYVVQVTVMDEVMMTQKFIKE